MMNPYVETFTIWDFLVGVFLIPELWMLAIGVGAILFFIAYYVLERAAIPFREEAARECRDGDGI
jgi:hypothetical protein